MGKKKPTPKKLVPVVGGAVLPSDYTAFLADLKTRVRSAQLKAAVAVNAEMIRLYWDIGLAIVQRQGAAGWGAKVIERLGVDLQTEFPGQSGFSRQNIYRMRAFVLAFAPSAEIVSQPARQFDPPPPFLAVPWFHTVTIVERVKDPAARLWYAGAATEFGWSRAVLDHQIDTDAYGRKGKAVSNFSKALPPVQSDLARETLKDPYSFSFLTLAEDHAEVELQRGLVDHIRQFLLELGAGFAFVGEQVHLEVGSDDFYLDLVFYHLKFRAFVIFDLKAKRFTPEAAGKMNFYLSAVDDLMRHPADNPSIGIILCRAKNRVVAEYALRDIEKPLAVSTYVTQLIASLPEKLAHELDPPDPERHRPQQVVKQAPVKSKIRRKKEG
jgi:predicted nuclease of restriction endonuclease-like (RecB) superfamily